MPKKIITLLFLFLLGFFQSGWADIPVKPGPKDIALTFDDGPDPHFTPKILDILDRYQIKATFFVVGQKAQQYSELLKEIRKRGHSIANHSWSHAALTKLPDSKLYQEVTDTNEVIQKITGQSPLCLRPPYGMSNMRLRELVKSENMAVILWDLNSFDYKKWGTKRLQNWVLSKSKPGYVILMHDGGGNRTQTIEALPIIIEGLQKRGLGFSKICE